MESNVHCPVPSNARSEIPDICRKRLSASQNTASEDSSAKRYKADSLSLAPTAVLAHNTSTQQCGNPPLQCPLVTNKSSLPVTLRSWTHESIDHHLELHRLHHDSSLPAQFAFAPSLPSIISLRPHNHLRNCAKLPSLDASDRIVCAGRTVGDHFLQGLDRSAIWVTREGATPTNGAPKQALAQGISQTSAGHELLRVCHAGHAQAAAPCDLQLTHVATNGAKRAEPHQPSRLLDLPTAVLERVLIFAGRAGCRAACSCHTIASIWHDVAMQPEYAARCLLEVFGPKTAAAYLYDIPELLKLARGERIPMVQQHRAGSGGCGSCGAHALRGRDGSCTNDEAAAAILRCLARAGADVVGTVEDVIAVAASKGHVRVVLLALQTETGHNAAGNDVGSEDTYDDGHSRQPSPSNSCLDHGSSSLALVMAAKAGQLSVVRAVMLATVSPPPAPDAVTAALTSACESGHVAVVLELLYGARDAHAAARGKGDFRSGCEVSAVGAALLAACRAGHSTCAALLLRLGPTNTQEALRAAAAAGHAGCVSLLLGPSLGTVVGRTVAAASGGSGGGVRASAVAIADGQSLLAAATAGHPTVVRQLLRAGADTRAPDAAKAMQAALRMDGSSATPAMSAASSGQCAGSIDIETLQALLDHGVAPSDDALTAAAVAAAKGAGGGIAAVKALLAAGADAAGGNTAAALLAACTGPHGAAAVKALLAAGADANARRGLPLMRACVAGHQETALTLLSAGARPNNRCGLALVAAARRGNPSLVSALITADTEFPRNAVAADDSTVHARYGSARACVPQHTAIFSGFADALAGLPVQHQQQMQQMQQNLEQWQKDLQDLARECREQEKRSEDIPLVADSGPLVAACAAAAATAENGGGDSDDGGDSGGAGGTKHATPDYVAVIRILLDAGCDANEASGLPLRLAAASGRMAVVRALLAGGADRAACGGQALVVASRRGYAHIVRELLFPPSPVRPLMATVSGAPGATTVISQLLRPPSMAPAATALAEGYRTMTMDVRTQWPLEEPRSARWFERGPRSDHELCDGGSGGGGARAGGCMPGASRALELATRNGHEDVVKQLLEAGVPFLATGRAAVEWWRGDVSVNRDVDGASVFG